MYHSIIGKYVPFAQTLIYLSTISLNASRRAELHFENRINNISQIFQEVGNKVFSAHCQKGPT